MRPLVPSVMRAAAAGARWCLPVRKPVGRCRGPVWGVWFGGSVVHLHGAGRGRLVGKLYCQASPAGAASRLRSFAASGRVDWVSPDKVPVKRRVRLGR